MKPPPSWFPYGQPDDPAALAQCDPLIVGLVQKINELADPLGPWTVQSCEGHPWPMLEVCGLAGTLGDIAKLMAEALGAKQQLVVTVVVPVQNVGMGPTMYSQYLTRWRFEVSAHDTPSRAAGRAVLGAPWGWAG